MVMQVQIRGKDAAPTARLLEVLTICNLLSERLTWTESFDLVTITLKDATDSEVSKWQNKRQYLVILA